MEKIQYLYFIAVIYLAIVLGSYVKMKNKNIKEMTFITCMLIPIIVFLASFITICNNFKKNGIGMKEKLLDLFWTLKTTFIGYPLLVTFSINYLSRASTRKMNKKSRKILSLIESMSKNFGNTLCRFETRAL